MRFLGLRATEVGFCPLCVLLGLETGTVFKASALDLATANAFFCLFFLALVPIVYVVGKEDKEGGGS